MKPSINQQPNPKAQKRLLAEKEAKQRAFELRLRQLDLDLIDAQDNLLQEQQRQDAEMLHLEGELQVLLATPPAKDGRDDARRIRQTSIRPLTEKELQLQEKKRLSPGLVACLFNRQLASLRLVEIRALRQEIKRDYAFSCQKLERRVQLLRTSRPFGQERQLQMEYAHLQREYQRLSLQGELLQIEIDSLRNSIP